MLSRKTLSIIVLFSCALFLISSIPFGRAAVEFNKSYGEETRYEVANSVIQTSDSGYAIVGSTCENAAPTDAWFVKTGASGEFQWSQKYGGPNSDSASSIVQNDGGYTIVGTKNDGVEDGARVWMIRTDLSGNLLWEKTYNYTEYHSVGYGFSVVQTKDGGYAIGCDLEWGGPDFISLSIIKTDSSGNMQWHQSYGSRSTTEKFSIVETKDGGFALASGKYRGDERFAMDFWLVKTDSTGNMQWNQTYHDGLGDVAFSMVQTEDGGYALAGRRGGTYTHADDRSDDFMLVKTDSNGQMLWLKTYGGKDFENAHSVVQTKDGGFAIAGIAILKDRNDFNTNLVVKTDALGNAQWTKTYESAVDGEVANSIIQSNDGGYAIAGYVNRQSNGYTDFWLVKTDENGNAPSIQALSASTLPTSTIASPSVPEFPISGIATLTIMMVIVSAFVFKSVKNRQQRIQ